MSYNDPIILQAEQQSCVTVLAVNTDCPQQVISNSQFLVDNEQCRDTDDAVTVRIDPLVEQRVYLTTDINERKDNSQEDNQHVVYNIKINDIEIQQGEADTNLTAKYGHDLSSVLNKQKNHQCSDVKVKAHDDPVKDLNDQVDQFGKENHSSSGPYDKMLKLRPQPQVCFDKANAQQEFFVSIEEDEAGIDEGRLHVDSDDDGGDLSSVQGRCKTHEHLEVELGSHRRSIQSPEDIGEKILSASHAGTAEIDALLQKLLENSEELKQMKVAHWQKLKKALVYKQLITSPDKEEMWIILKQHLPFAEDYRDTFAGMQGQAERHNVFQTDCQTKQVDCNEIQEKEGKLISKGNHDDQNFLQFSTSPRRKMDTHLEVANCCHANLADNSLQQLIWSIGILESGMVD